MKKFNIIQCEPNTIFNQYLPLLTIFKILDI